MNNFVWLCGCVLVATNYALGASVCSSSASCVGPVSATEEPAAAGGREEEPEPNSILNGKFEDRNSTTLKGAILGFYKDENGVVSLTKAASGFDDAMAKKISTFLASQLATSIRPGKARVLWGFHDDYAAISLVHIGKENRGINEVEQRDDQKEAVRVAVAVGVRSLWDGSGKTITQLDVDSMGEPEAASEAAHLSLWVFDVLKKSMKTPPQLNPIEITSDEEAAWNRGKVTAESQNFARFLSEMPANLMTPTIFAAKAKEALEPLGVAVNAHEKPWIEEQKMGSFLSVAAGSAQPPIFLEIIYNGTEPSDPYVLVGKGITFDSGGVSLKTPSTNMDWMRGDMSGAGTVVATIRALASLKIPVNVVGLAPLTENMMGGRATKVMDVVTAMNGKTIEVGNTDAEGRLVLADGLAYAEKFKPKLIVDIATLTGTVVSALGRSASGVFTRHTKEWEKLLQASIKTGDRMWRLPLWDVHLGPMSDAHLADLSNRGSGDKIARSSCAAAFLKEFVPKDVPWLHLDIAGASQAASSAEMPYYGKGFTGRPVRALFQFVVDHD